MGRESERFAAAFRRVATVDEAGELWQRSDAIYAHKVRELPSAVGKALVVAVHDHDETCVRSHRYLPVSREPCARPPGLGCVLHGCVVVRDRGAGLGVALWDPFGLGCRTRQLAERSPLVVASAYMRRSLLDAGVGPDRVVVVHPVPPDEGDWGVEAPSEPVLAFVGQVITGKGLDLLLRALVLVPRARLRVAGDGAQRGSNEGLARRLGLEGRVEFLGAVSPEATRQVYDRARVVVVPSRWPEPFGMVGIEAMRRGRVVVAARHGGIPEWLHEGAAGFGFCPGDIGDLARVLEEALEGRDYGERAERGRAYARETLSFRAMIERVERVLGVEGA